MILMIPHLSFLLFSIFLLYLIRNKSSAGLIHILVSFISFLFAIYTLINKNIFLYKEINVIEVLENITISFNLDYLGLVFLIVSNGLWFMTSIYTNRYLKLNNYQSHGKFFIFFLISMMSTNAIIYSANLFTTFIFYEILNHTTFAFGVSASFEDMTTASLINALFYESARCFAEFVIASQIFLGKMRLHHFHPIPLGQNVINPIFLVPYFS